MSDETTPSAGVGTACCAMARRMPREKINALNAELLEPNHRGFKKLAMVHGTNHMAVKRHKVGCLGLGAAEREQEGERPKEQGEREGEHGGNTGTVRVAVFPPSGNNPDAGPPPRARAPVVAEDRVTHEERVLAIVSRIADGRLVPSDVPTWAATWGLSERTIRGMVREAFLHARVDRGTVEERRTLAMGMWETQISMCDGELAGKLKPMDRAMLLRERREAMAGWCKAAGVFDDATKVQVNITTHPIFVELIDSVMATLRNFPEARAAVVTAMRSKAMMLHQPTIEATGVVVGNGDVER